MLVNIKYQFKKRLFVGVSISVLMLSGCYYDKEEILYPGSGTVDCTTVPAGFAADVRPLIQSKCAISGCHNAAGASGGVVLENYSQISGKKDRINARAVVERSMPPTGPLTNAEAAKIKCWIDAGGLNN
jgi:uncharacterized membrane protein